MLLYYLLSLFFSLILLFNKESAKLMACHQRSDILFFSGQRSSAVILINSFDVLVAAGNL